LAALNLHGFFPLMGRYRQAGFTDVSYHVYGAGVTRC
jgi:hypothetical protein